MLTLYVLRSKGDTIDIRKTAKSVGDVMRCVVSVNYSFDIDPDVVTSWYMVLYDNEVADVELAASFRSFLSFKGADVFKIYKKLGPAPYRFSIAPRIFRSGIKLRDNSLIPEVCDGLRFETILNGWLENIDDTED